MEHSPSWETNWPSSGQEIPRLLWNPKVHYLIHNTPPPVPILSQTSSLRAFPPHFLMSHFNIILQSTHRSPKRPLSIRSPNRNSICASLDTHTCYMGRLSHSSWFVVVVVVNDRSQWPLSKEWVCSRSLAGIEGSNPSAIIDDCLLLVSCVVRQKSLPQADYSSRGVLSSVACVRLCDILQHR